MECPKCKSDMESANIEGMVVNRCLQCYGVWFHEREYLQLKKNKVSEQIDIGTAELGREFNSAEEVPCPICNESMEKVSDSFQTHIQFESCPFGHGVFFDAGEYRDLKTLSVGDLFKRIF